MTTRTARCVLLVATLLVAVAIGHPTDARAKGNPHRGTTTTTAPRIPTTLTVHPPAPVIIPGCTPLIACPKLAIWALVSARLTTADGTPIPDRLVALNAGRTEWGGAECEARTDATGLARCLSTQPDLLSAVTIASWGRFDGDTTYERSEGTFGPPTA